jgi:ADP-ribosyl-[dinitrogen reductase] hydrolase
MLSSDIVNRMKGCFYGCAVGDALGSPLEFKWRDKTPLVTEMIPTDNHGGLPAGCWTDDTSMMLCLAASMVARDGKCDARSELTHYWEWFRNGYLGVNGTCVDIGGITRRSLLYFHHHGEPISDEADELAQGNGSLMRIAPVPILCWNDPEKAYAYGAESSVTTHNHRNCAVICGIVASVITRCIAKQRTKADVLEMLKSMVYVADEPRLQEILRGEFIDKLRCTISSSGFILDTLEAALWAFFSTEDFEAGAILAVNLARDADTVGAVYGTIAGAYYGFDTIPERWLKPLQGRRYLDGVWADILDFVKK